MHLSSEPYGSPVKSSTMFPSFDANRCIPAKGLDVQPTVTSVENRNYALLYVSSYGSVFKNNCMSVEFLFMNT